MTDELDAPDQSQNIDNATERSEQWSSILGEVPKKGADAVVLLADTLRDRAIRPALLAVRGVVFGIVIAAMAPIVVVLLCIALIRVLDNYAFAQHVWITYYTIGAIFSATGLFLWSRREAKDGNFGVSKASL